MFTKVKKMLAGTEREAGFTLVELLIVILIVGILSAVALPLYLGYTKDARLAEGKAVGGSALTALSGCVQAKGSGSSCVISEVYNRVGLIGGTTYDSRWLVTGSLAVDTGAALTGSIGVAGNAGNTTGMAVAFHMTSTGVVLRCDTTSATPPGVAGGEPC